MDIAPKFFRILGACLVLLAARPCDAGRISQIDVEARLANDGRFHVVETHHLRIDKGYDTEFRVFGLAADQTIVIKSITRIDQEGNETRLVDQEVTGPDQYRYYPLGHVYYHYPAVEEETEFRYRFEYEVVNAVAPAWGLGAGPEPLEADFVYANPFERLKSIAADAREAWPDPWKRYRLDHSVLFPDRGAFDDEALEIKYTLVYDTAWRRLVPNAELAKVTEDKEYRVRHGFEYLPEGAPPGAANHEAAIRAWSIGAVLAFGLLSFLLMLLWEGFSLLLGRRLDPAEAAERLSRLAPEETHFRWNDEAPFVTVDSLLQRLAGEGKIAIELVPTEQPEQAGEEHIELPPEVRLRLLVPPDSLPVFERRFLDELFDENQRTATSQRIRQKSAESGVTPERSLRTLLEAAAPETKGSAWLPIPFGLLALWALYKQLPSERFNDILPVVLVNALAIMVASAWPRGWWHGERPKRGLLVLLIVLASIFAAFHCLVNRPFPAGMWMWSAVAIVSLYVAQLSTARLGKRGSAKVLRDLVGVRRFAKRELRHQHPQLEDRWLPHLVALGLEGDIERWRQEHVGMVTRTADHRHGDPTRGYSGVPFTGQSPQPPTLPAGWADVLFYEPADLVDYEDEEDDELEAEDASSS